MKVSEIMTPDVDTCSPQATIQEVATRMRDLDVGSIPIAENDSLIGIVTDRDIVVRAIADQLSLDRPISEILSSDPVTGKIDMSVEDAANLMSQHQIRRLPIVENDKLVGIVSLGDIAVKDESYDNAEVALDDVSEPAEPDR
ncbi:CBS domain-containing protein [Planococcus sp. N028]|uniref:CBS domain-containing protein n=1 Tax=Planococcus shixiaomingii TaxID=3058393 RepID=A0ABT8N2D5_9BACL|nr:MULTISPECIES: CBS domain-containing protein [unclassified Planococcus (in: firmicutes)]MDN7242054.1 CBS domain-containing protein [Planococcus sp. N028]WKA54329.1 CBS domain-containing protein [Planococcus sp. N022]